ncbi:UNVERIFIED_CONTAM: hypothetical protein Sindi_1274700 [Sesamum indicum]
MDEMISLTPPNLGFPANLVLEDEDDRIAPANGVFQAKECDQTKGETSALISHGKGGTLNKKKTVASAPQFLGFAATWEDDETRDSLPAQGFRGMGGTQLCGKDVSVETIDPKLGFNAATMGDAIDAESKLSGFNFNEFLGLAYRILDGDTSSITTLNELKRRWEEKFGGCELNRATTAPVSHPKPRRCTQLTVMEEKEMNTEYARSRFLPEKNQISTEKLQFSTMGSSSPATMLVLPVDDAAPDMDMEMGDTAADLIEYTDDVINEVSPDDVIHDVSPNDVIHDVSPDDVTHDVSPNDVIHDVSPDDVSHDVSPDVVRCDVINGIIRWEHTTTYLS